jgi:hypothetical protein
MRVLGAALVAGAAALLGAPAGAQQAPRPCTAAELGQTLLINGTLEHFAFFQDERIDGPLAARSSYRLEVSAPGFVVAETIRVTGPGGQLPTASGGAEPSFDLVTGAPGALPITISWEQQLVDANGQPTDTRCSGSGGAVLTVRDPRPVRVLTEAGRRAFALTVRPAAVLPRSTRPVTYEIRVRRGHAVAPSLRTPALARFTYGSLVLGPALHSVERQVRGVGTFRVLRGIRGGTSRGRVVLEPSRISPGQTRRFGFSVRVTQGGEVVGGMRGGVVCRGVRVSAGRRDLRCTRSGFASAP